MRERKKFRHPPSKNKKKKERERENEKEEILIPLRKISNPLTRKSSISIRIQSDKVARVRYIAKGRKRSSIRLYLIL